MFNHRIVMFIAVSTLSLSSQLAGIAVADGMHFGPKVSDRPVVSLDQTVILAVGDARTATIVRTGLRDASDGAAWFMPVPARPYDVRIVEDPFPALDRLTMPIDQQYGGGRMPGAGGAIGGPAREEVVVAERMILGVMDVAVLSAESTAPLMAWLDREGFRAPDGVEEVFADYVERGWWWIVAKLAKPDQFARPDAIDAATGKSTGGKSADSAVPKPLAFTYDAPAVYPMTISRLSASPWTDIALFVVAPHRTTILGPHGAPMAEMQRFVDRRHIPGDPLPFLVTQMASPIEAWLDSPPLQQFMARRGWRSTEESGDRWRTFAALAPMLDAVGLPVPGRGVESSDRAEAEPVAWITRLRMQLRPREMNWDLAIIRAGDQRPVPREL